MLKLLTEFLDSSASFAHGFECGILWNQMRRGDRIIKGSYHLENYEQIVMMSNYWLYAITACTFHQPSCGWVEITFKRKFWQQLIQSINVRLLRKT